MRRSRSLPYRLAVDAEIVDGSRQVRLHFINQGSAGAVFQVYDRQRLDRIPRRYTVEAGKRIEDAWDLSTDGGFDLWVLGPNGFLRHFRSPAALAVGVPSVTIRQHRGKAGLLISLRNPGQSETRVTVGRDAYGKVPPRQIALAGQGKEETIWQAGLSHDWYDFTVTLAGMEIRAAGRLEQGRHGVSDPLMAMPVPSRAG